MKKVRIFSSATEFTIYFIIIIIVLLIDSILTLLSFCKKGLYKQDILLKKTDLGFDVILHH